MKEIILKKLLEIEKLYNIRILYACESGSRAWGFASKDSDYDVRFIYIRPYTDYLKLYPYRDVIEYEVNDVFDINGWDIKKFLCLLNASNPVLFEWLTSPVVYYEDKVFCECKSDFFKAFYPEKSMAHYYSIASKTYSLHVKGRTEVRYKKYFYVLRPLLCIKWIKKYKTIPPLEFDILKNEFLQGVELERVNELLKKKKEHKEKDTIPFVYELNERIAQELESKPVVFWKEHRIDADSLFLKLLKNASSFNMEQSHL